MTTIQVLGTCLHGMKNYCKKFVVNINNGRSINKDYNSVNSFIVNCALYVFDPWSSHDYVVCVVVASTIFLILHRCRIVFLYVYAYVDLWFTLFGGMVLCYLLVFVTGCKLPEYQEPFGPYMPDCSWHDKGEDSWGNSQDF